MPISNSPKHFPIVAGTALLVATVGVTPASAITFNFQGNNLQGSTSPTSIEGSYTVDDEALARVINGPVLGPPARLDFFSLTLDGNLIFSGIPSRSSLGNVPQFNGPFFGSTLLLNVDEALFDFALGVIQLGTVNQPRCGNVTTQVCDAVVQVTGEAVGGTPTVRIGPVTQQPVNVKPVPEPAATVLALGVVGALMLMRQRKLGRAPQASDKYSAS